MAAINQSSWRDRAILRSEGITDAWEVTKTYAGRLAEWILFACMIGCILEVLVAVPLWLSNTILGVQAVTLDIGGFALSSMADQARANGDEQAARKADVTGRFLIGIVILTLTLITVGLLYAPAKQYTDGAEKVLILIRVVMTVVYGHVIHGLRRQTASIVLTPAQPASDDVLHELRSEIAQLSAQIITLQAPQTAPEIAPKNTLSSGVVSDESAPVDAPETLPEEPQEERNNITLMSDRRSASKSAQTRSEKARKAASIIRRNPQISAPDLAKKAQISTSYARKLLVNQ